jgi:hypothetical protein
MPACLLCARERSRTRNTPPMRTLWMHWVHWKPATMDNVIQTHTHSRGTSKKERVSGGGENTHHTERPSCPHPCIADRVENLSLLLSSTQTHNTLDNKVNSHRFCALTNVMFCNTQTARSNVVSLFGCLCLLTLARRCQQQKSNDFASLTTGLTVNK